MTNSEIKNGIKVLAGILNEQKVDDDITKVRFYKKQKELEFNMETAAKINDVTNTQYIFNAIGDPIIDDELESHSTVFLENAYKVNGIVNNNYTSTFLLSADDIREYASNLLRVANTLDLYDNAFKVSNQLKFAIQSKLEEKRISYINLTITNLNIDVDKSNFGTARIGIKIGFKNEVEIPTIIIETAGLGEYNDESFANMIHEAEEKYDCTIFYNKEQFKYTFDSIDEVIKSVHKDRMDNTPTSYTEEEKDEFEIIRQGIMDLIDRENAAKKNDTEEE